MYMYVWYNYEQGYHTGTVQIISKQYEPIQLLGFNGVLTDFIVETSYVSAL